MKSRLFRFFDTSPYNLHPVFWIHGAKIATVVSEVFGSIEWRGKTETEIAINSKDFMPIWKQACINIAQEAKQNSNLIYMDMEHIPYIIDGKHDLQFAIAMAEIIKNICPGLKISCYSAPIADIINLDYLILYDQGKTNDAYNKNIKDSLKFYKPLVDLLDAVDLPAYLLGKDCFDRDIAAIKTYRRLIKRYYPDINIIQSAWGRYHDAWNFTPEEYIIEQNKLYIYANLLTKNGDDIIIFDEVIDRDNFFIQQLKNKSEATEYV